MRVELEPPPWYESLPSVVSETTDRFRWPIGQTIQIWPPPPDRLSVQGPLQSPPPRPRLKYHRQSTYSDVFTKYPLKDVAIPKTESLWINPIGKSGKFWGESTYEREYMWPPKVERQQESKIPPLISTMGLGIIPILGQGDGPGVHEKPVDADDTAVVKKGLARTFLESQRRENPSYWVRNCNPSKPTELIWRGQTSHKRDYVLHPVGSKLVSKTSPPKPNIRCTEKMETVSSMMRDYPEPTGQSKLSSRTCNCLPGDDF